MKRAPMWKKQANALEFAIDRVDQNKGVGLLLECGCGKTRIAVHWLEHLFRTRGAKLVYVAAPLSALHVWVENWHNWGFAPVAFINLHESGSAGLRKAKELAAEGFPVICLVNYEAAWQIGFKRIPRIRHGETVRILEKVDTAMHDLKWDVGILDESTFIKSPGAKVSKYFRKKMVPRTKHRMVMSGSAYIKRPLDVWAQINFACGDEVFPPTFRDFKSIYAIPHPYIRGAVIGYHNLGSLTKRLAKVAIMLKKTDILDLPPFTHETRLVSLCEKSRRIYDDLVEETIAELDTGTVSADHIFAVMRKLMQITGGFVYPDADEDRPDIRPAPVRLGTEKLEVLMSILEERDSPTVIITQFDEEERIIVEAVRKRFNFIPKVLNGSVKGEARQEMIQAAASDPVFIMKEAVGARGIDVKFADMMIFYSHSYNTEAYTQILSRNHRGGQTHNITYIHLLCRNTIDNRVMRALERDLSLAESIENDWRQLFE
jgi:SNF2 family DNA or RNA helicase